MKKVNTDIQQAPRIVLDFQDKLAEDLREDFSKRAGLWGPLFVDHKIATSQLPVSFAMTMIGQAISLLYYVAQQKDNPHNEDNKEVIILAFEEAEEAIRQTIEKLQGA